MITLCLVNTYDKLKLHEAHLRSIARIAPICYAFDFHLALYDFPFWKREEEVVDAVCDYTTIGEGGKYLRELHESGKFHLIESFESRFGEIVATTSKPDESKKISLDDIARFRSAIFLFGLGRKGLPKDVLKKAKYHFEATGKNVSLETCTAIGVVATLIWVVRHGRHKNVSETRVL
ncbi:Protein of unknown function DUF531 [Ferroglobus placidus DSM 10642]|uniref:DUF531 domain-containing protein n=1 Tax=Ferroglobus placidus (strain DSM 10642 / AEDII12DO) TaxID=589924 RepID=D3RWY3_FERPA|nr:DUF531 domain-containing protein [Ferroglobus placidus]ADC64996.1 Protein of unknown function DUF531 [Ferroglobus placidus DSM 10642]